MFIRNWIKYKFNKVGSAASDLCMFLQNILIETILAGLLLYLLYMCVCVCVCVCVRVYTHTHTHDTMLE
jgi:hypothetical protein